MGAYKEDGSVAGFPDDNSLEDSGAVFIFIRDVSFWYRQAYLKTPAMDFHDEFGFFVALSTNGDTLIIGVPGEDNGTVIAQITPFFKAVHFTSSPAVVLIGIHGSI